MQNEKNIRDALRAVLEKLIEVAPTAEQEWPELVRRAKDALASDDIDPAWAGVCAACSEGIQPKRCAYYGDPNGCNAPTLGKHTEGDLAERLQEELEKAERRIAELEHVPGNAAAMREALEQALAYCESDQKSGIAYSDNDVLVPMLRAALAAPARNCDVGTAQEQIDRFHEFCHSNRYYIDEFHGDDCRPDCPIGKIVDRDNKFCDNCWAAWAQLPFAPAEGGKE